MEEKNNIRSLTGMTLAMLIFGSIGIFRRYLPVSSELLAFLRGVIGSAFLYLMILLRRKNALSGFPRREILRYILCGAMNGINWILLFEAYRYTTVGIATLCYYMQPSIVILLSPIFLREKLTWKKLICAAVSVLGMVLVTGLTGSETVNITGVLYGLSAAVLYAIVVIINKKAPDYDSYGKTLIQIFSSAVILFPYLIMTGSFQFTSLRIQTIVLLVIVGIFHTGVAYVLYFDSLKGIKAQTAAVLGYIDPVFALILSAVFLNESLSAAGCAGAVMILLSSLISERGS
ncbi:MAG: EamA family transporter [Solobacterium sp.]|nr:EamA family transporter [Solobacterium sp.]